MEQQQQEIKSQVRFPADVQEAMKQLAHQHQRSFNGEVIWALKQYLKTQHKQEEQRDEASCNS